MSLGDVQNNTSLSAAAPARPRRDLAPIAAVVPNWLVVDTNVVLDLFVFRDSSANSIAVAVLSPAWVWIGSQCMRDELERVLEYAPIAARLRCSGVGSAQVLAQYDAQVQPVARAPQASAICQDPDDQKFIDLAVHHRAVLVSKDKAILVLKNRLAVLGACALTVQEFAA